MAATIAIPADRQDSDHARINLSVTVAEKRRLADAAQSAGLTVAEYVRRHVFESVASV